MVTDAILGALFAGIGALLSLFPTFTLPTIDGSHNQAILAVAQLNRVVPISTVIEALLAVLGVRLLLSGWDFVVWIYHQFWGSD